MSIFEAAFLRYCRSPVEARLPIPIDDGLQRLVFTKASFGKKKANEALLNEGASEASSILADQVALPGNTSPDSIS